MALGVVKKRIQEDGEGEGEEEGEGERIGRQLTMVMVQRMIHVHRFITRGSVRRRLSRGQ
jgi:hypothetical protein